MPKKGIRSCEYFGSDGKSGKYYLIFRCNRLFRPSDKTACIYAHFVADPGFGCSGRIIACGHIFLKIQKGLWQMEKDPCSRAESAKNAEIPAKQKNKEENERKNTILIILIILILLAAALLFFFRMRNAHALFMVRDKDGVWRASFEADIFGENAIAPGSSGEYCFTVINMSGGKLKYSIYLDCEYDSGDGLPPIEYKFENIDGRFTFDEESGRYILRDATVCKNGAKTMILKWEWPYENGRDNEDTNIGFAAGEYRCTVSVEGIR